MTTVPDYVYNRNNQGPESICCYQGSIKASSIKNKSYIHCLPGKVSVETELSKCWRDDQKPKDSLFILSMAQISKYRSSSTKLWPMGFALRSEKYRPDYIYSEQSKNISSSVFVFPQNTTLTVCEVPSQTSSSSSSSVQNQSSRQQRLGSTDKQIREEYRYL